MRVTLTLLGMLIALMWPVLFVRAPGVALELLLLTSPLAAAAYLIVTLTAPRRPGGRARQQRPRTAAAEVRDRVLARDRGICGLCRGAGATTVVARRLMRAGEDPLDRYLSLCDGCAATASLRPRQT